MEYVKSELQVYLDYEGRKMKEYSDLLTKFNDLESKRAIHTTNNAPKVAKKEKLLELKKSGITSKLDDIELQKIEDDENAERVKDNLMQQIEDKKRRAIEKIEAEHKKALDNAERAYEDSKDYCMKQYDMMINKSARIYKQKKSILESRGQLVSSELDIITEVKSAPEVTIDKQQETLLTQMSTILEAVKNSRQNPIVVNQQDKLPPLPQLPRESQVPSNKSLEVSAPPQKRVTFEQKDDVKESFNYLSPEELELQEMRKAIQKEIQNREAKEEHDRQERKEQQRMDYEAGKQRYEEQLKKLQEDQGTSSNTTTSDPKDDEKPEPEEEKEDIWDTEGMSDSAKAAYIKSLLKQGLMPPAPQVDNERPPIISNTKTKKVKTVSRR